MFDQNLGNLSKEVQITLVKIAIFQATNNIFDQ